MAECPNAAEHAQDEPAGYVAWFGWAARKRKTHRQLRCRSCGLYKVWVPRA